jgi:hypothetical protein
MPVNPARMASAVSLPHVPFRPFIPFSSSCQIHLEQTPHSRRPYNHFLWVGGRADLSVVGSPHLVTAPFLFLQGISYHKTSSCLFLLGVQEVQAMAEMHRANWANFSDAQLLSQCEVDTYRASGPGGQKRNKTSSAVRLRHPPTRLIVIAEESRSQHENRRRALRRLRQALYLKIRDELEPNDLHPNVLAARPGFCEARTTGGRLDLGRKDPRFWPAVGVVLDVLNAVGAQVSTAAGALGISTANLVDFLATDPKVWEQVNHLRSKFGQKPLRSS